jgi:hypothetical protein
MVIIQTLNLITILGVNNNVELFWISTAIIFFINGIIFLNKKRFKDIIDQFQKNRPSILIRVIVFGYIIVSFVAFVLFT